MNRGSAKPLPVAIIGRLLAGLGGAGMVDLASVALNGMTSIIDPHALPF